MTNLLVYRCYKIHLLTNYISLKCFTLTCVQMMFRLRSLLLFSFVHPVNVCNFWCFCMSKLLLNKSISKLYYEDKLTLNFCKTSKRERKRNPDVKVSTATSPERRLSSPIDVQATLPRPTNSTDRRL